MNETVYNDWRRVLLLWVKECQYSAVSTAFEELNINEFYVAYIESLKLKKYPNKPATVHDFLKAFYPSIHIESSDDGNNHLPSSSDNVIAFTLLLHFCCVKNPDKKFQQMCTKLPTKAQHVIALCFEKMLKHKDLTRELLKQIITEVENVKYNDCDRRSLGTPETSQCGEILEYEANNSSEKQLISPNVEGTTSAAFNWSPERRNIMQPTPRSALLDRRTRELNHVKVLLDGERYERGLLEAQLKTEQERTLNLATEMKNLRLRLAAIENENIQQTEVNERLSSNTDIEHIKKPLIKDITKKNEEIRHLYEEIDDIKSELEYNNGKLILNEKLLDEYLRNIECLESQNEKLLGELEDRNAYIAMLNNNKRELEEYINDVRLERRAERDCTLELFEVSTSTPNNSFTNAANMGSCIVEMQLHEKEREYALLTCKLNLISAGITKLTTFLRQHSEQDNVEQQQANQSEEQLLESALQQIQDIFDDRNESYQYIKDLQSEIDALRKERESCEKLKTSEDLLLAKIEMLEKQFVMEQSNAMQLAKLNEEQLVKKDMESQNMRDEMLAEIGKLQNQLKAEIRANEERAHKIQELESSSTELETKYQLMVAEIQTKSIELTELRNSVEEKSAQVTSLKDALSKQNETIQMMRDQIEELERIQQTLTDANRQYDDRERSGDEKLKAYEKTIGMLKDELEQRKAKIAALECELIGAIDKDAYESVIRECKTTEVRLLALNSELKDTANLKDQLQKRIQQLEEEALQQKNEQIKSIQNEELMRNADLEQEKPNKPNKELIAADQRILETKSAAEKEYEKSCDERLKATQLKMEGKLEKMKQKMKMLYNAETAKMRAKQEREIVLLSDKNSLMRTQIQCLEKQIRKLTKQILNLNNEILDLKKQKQNTHLSMKPKHPLSSSSSSSLQNSRANICVPQTTTTTRTTASSGSSMMINRTAALRGLVTNLAMEDEQGEVFNNTYLADIKRSIMGAGKG